MKKLNSDFLGVIDVILKYHDEFEKKLRKLIKNTKVDREGMVLPIFDL